MTVTSAYAKANLPDLLKAVENGESVRITRYHKPVARLVPYSDLQEAKPKLGTAPSSVKIVDPNWAKPPTQKQMRQLLETGATNCVTACLLDTQAVILAFMSPA